ncbi:MAG: ABC transporter substrate-binding protein [Chlorobium phaeobacteroides]|nr:ABC transporter substrate-binding protein [Chlorobium phaeobacteroides]
MKNIFLILLALLFSGCAGKPSVVSQSPYITRTLQYLGLEDRIVGISCYDDLELPKTGGIIDPDKKAIAALAPDFIFTSDWTAPDVLHDVTPDGTEAIVLQGFHRMDEIEQNLRVLSKSLGLKNGVEMAAEFSSAWRKAAEEVDGGGKRALILSSCQGEPFSFGRNTYLYDLFTVAGFHVVETHLSIRHVNASGEIKSVEELLRATEPEVVFVLQDDDHGCSVDLSEGDFRVVLLNGEHFVYPAPVLLDGIADLKVLFPVSNNDNQALK